jgi:hypothetical protein
VPEKAVTLRKMMGSPGIDLYSMLPQLGEAPGGAPKPEGLARVPEYCLHIQAGKSGPGEGDIEAALFIAATVHGPAGIDGV